MRHRWLLVSRIGTGAAWRSNNIAQTALNSGAAPRHRAFIFCLAPRSHQHQHRLRVARWRNQNKSQRNQLGNQWQKRINCGVA
jgi:hypothetical protein